MQVLLLCACGCRQLETTSPKATAIAAPSAETPASSRSSSAQTVAVYRIPAEDDNDRRTAGAAENSPVDCTILPPRGPDHLVATDDGTAGPRPGDATESLDQLQLGPIDDAARPLSQGGETDVAAPPGRFHEILATTCDDVWHDYGNYYSRSTAVKFVAILAPAAVFANTNLDADFGNWYQTHIRSSATNEASNYFRQLGNGFYTIPVYVSAKFLGEYFDDVPCMAFLGQFGDRATRALMVGAPPLLAAQYLTGGGRPYLNYDQSYWKPFHSSHGASGHAFMGAVPFLTLAGMTDDPLAKCFFYACSPWTGMTRINDNVHYLSQVWLGWWMAYLACESVNKTEGQKGPLQFVPLVTPEITGVGVVYEH